MLKLLLKYILSVSKINFELLYCFILIHFVYMYIYFIYLFKRFDYFFVQVISLTTKKDLEERNFNMAAITVVEYNDSSKKW